MIGNKLSLSNEQYNLSLYADNYYTEKDLENLENMGLITHEFRESFSCLQ